MHKGFLLLLRSAAHLCAISALYAVPPEKERLPAVFLCFDPVSYTHLVVLAVVQLAADIMPIKGDLAGSGVIQADDAAADGGLAGTGLAHQTIGLAGIDLKADVIHSLDGIRCV